MEDAAEDTHGQDDGRGRAPVETAHEREVDAAGEDHERGGLADRAGGGP